MKTSKRLLSILLMLTMLLSMFTVMASAEEPEDSCMHRDEELNTTFTIFHAAATATCFQEGHVAYYECKTCHAKAILNEDDGKFIVQQNGIPKIAIDIDPTNHGGKLPKTPAQEPTCGANGNYEYYYCSGCNKYFKDEDGKIPFTSSVVIPATGNHKLEPVDAKDPTCTEDGYEAYWKCSVCGQKFSDAEGKNKISAPTEIKASGHKGYWMSGQEASCTKDGRKVVWHCDKCGKNFTDETAKTEVTDADLVIKATGHTLTKTDYKAATRTEEGNIAYWHCSVCDKYFADEACTNEITKAQTVIPKLKEEKHVLTINVPKVDNKVAGTVTYEGAELPKLEGLQNGDTRTLVAEAKDGYEFLKWEVTGATFSSDTNTTTTVKMGDTDATITAKFVKKTAPVDTFKLTVEQVGDHGTFKIRKKLDNGKWGDWWTAADDDSTSIEISNLKKGTIYQIKAVPGTNYEASWKVNNKTATVDNDIYTATINKNDISVKITFTKIDTKNLKLSVDLDERHGKLKYYDDDEEKWVTYDDEYWTLSKGDKVEFKAVPDSGYKAVWQLGSGSKTSATYYDVTYRDMDGKNRTLHVDFVKKSSSDVDDYPTLTFDITGGKHGTVYRGTREYEDGDVISIKKNDKMTFKAKADKGYVAVWTYKGDTYVGDEYTVKMGSKDAKLYVEFMDKDDIRLTELPFRDVSKRDWYYDDVVYVYRKGYMDGMSSTRFGGELNTTRGQIVTILWRLTGEPRATKRNPFSDVSSSQYYYDAISWAYDAGVVDGFDAYTFKPDQNVTREQLAAILYRYAKYMNLSTSGSAYLAKYRDADKIANWAYDAMAWANYRGLINGTSATRIDPKGYATRAQIAAILHRFAVEYGA